MISHSHAHFLSVLTGICDQPINRINLTASVMLSEYACACLHSDKKQLRKQNLAAFKDGSIRFLICTDVAARGIDIHELPYVISM